MNEIRRTQIFITVVALVVAILHVVRPDITIDAITVFLLSSSFITLVNSINKIAGISRWVES